MDPRARPRAERARAFDRVADIYDEARPGYPEALLERLLALAALPTDAHVLEVGCGTGQATLPLARRGYRVTCLEPGPELAGLARQRMAGFARVTVVSMTFEAWPLRAGAFDLVLSAQAFHWIPVSLGLTKAADALRSGGGLALVWNRPTDGSAPYRAGFDEAYRRYAPSLARSHTGETVERWISGWKEAIDRSGRFGGVTVERFPWTAEYDVTRYLRLLGTHSDHIALPPETRKALYGALADEIRRQGGTITVERTAVLFFARRAT